MLCFPALVVMELPLGVVFLARRFFVTVGSETTTPVMRLRLKPILPKMQRCHNFPAELEQ